MSENFAPPPGPSGPAPAAVSTSVVPAPDSSAFPVRIDALGPEIGVPVKNDPNNSPLQITGRVDVDLKTVAGLILQLGQAVMVASLPVTVASDQPPIPVAGAVTSPDGGLATVGTTQDLSVFGDLPGSVIAQLRGQNAQFLLLHQTLRETNGLLSKMLSALQALAFVSQVDPANFPQ